MKRRRTIGTSFHLKNIQFRSHLDDVIYTIVLFYSTFKDPIYNFINAGNPLVLRLEILGLVCVLYFVILSCNLGIASYHYTMHQ